MEQDFELSPAVRIAGTPEGAVVLDIHANRLLATNLVGAAILGSIKTGNTEAQIISEIAHKYGVTQEIARSDYLEFRKMLTEQGILRQPENTRGR